MHSDNPISDLHENTLETALRVATDEPAFRPDFYKALLEATVYILGHSDNGTEGNRTLQTGENISIHNWVRNDGSPVIPFFSSITAMQRAIDQETKYMAMPARSLLEITKGSSLVLNPKSQYGKEFFPNEIEVLLTNGVNHLPEQRITKIPTQVLLGQPANYPSKMVDSLTIFLTKRSNVKAAYLAQMHDASQDENPRLVFGIDVDGDFEQIIREAGVVIVDTASTISNGGTVDIIHVTPEQGGLSEYFIKEVKPFYERTWGSKLKSFLGSSRA